jgi:hypothetical protein
VKAPGARPLEVRGGAGLENDAQRRLGLVGGQRGLVIRRVGEAVLGQRRERAEDGREERRHEARRRRVERRHALRDVQFEEDEPVHQVLRREAVDVHAVRHEEAGQRRAGELVSIVAKCGPVCSSCHCPDR